ncbi:LPXTG cell wall anchor domain-containing protein [Streptococcus sp. X13SY08]|nr:LPXTG cell wall anchor domain-containing protein [Streptococcus sp. X13SY08]
MDEADDKRQNLTSITITDNLDNLFAVKKDQVAVKVIDAPQENANFIDEDVEKSQAALDDEKAKLEEIKQSGQTEAATAALAKAQATVAALETQLAEAQAKLTELKAMKSTEASTTEQPATDTASSTDTSVAGTTIDNSVEIAAQEALIADVQAKLEAAKVEVQKAQEALAQAKTAEVQERMAQLAKVNAKGGLTAEAIAALGGTIKVEGQLVTVEFTDEDTMEALRGYTVNVIIYSSITDVKALTDDHFTKGIDNTATVQFNHDPNANLIKKTNKVTVVPPKEQTLPPTPPKPEEPKGDLPTPPKKLAPTPKPATPILPKTGSVETGFWSLLGLGLAALGIFALSKKKKDV